MEAWLCRSLAIGAERGMTSTQSRFEIWGLLTFDADEVVAARLFDDE